MAAPHYGIFI